MPRMTRKQRSSPPGVPARTSRPAAAGLSLALGVGVSLALGTGEPASEPTSATVTFTATPEPPCPGYGNTPDDRGGYDKRGRHRRI